MLGHVLSFTVSIRGTLRTMPPTPHSDAALELKVEKATPVVACEVHPGIAVPIVFSLACGSGCGNSAPRGKRRGKAKKVWWLDNMVVPRVSAQRVRVEGELSPLLLKADEAFIVSLQVLLLLHHQGPELSGSGARAQQAQHALQG